MTNTASPLISGAPTQKQVKSLRGTWRNELGSELVLEDDGNGAMNGTYRSGKGGMEGAAYPVCGAYDPAPSGSCRVLGFVVDWTELHALTVWSGQYQSDDETIRATWLMTTETDKTEEWKSTFVGHDVFRR
jgi:Avidin family